MSTYIIEINKDKEESSYTVNLKQKLESKDSNIYTESLIAVQAILDSCLENTTGTVKDIEEDLEKILEQLKKPSESKKKKSVREQLHEELNKLLEELK